jgi:hypothetical protein
MMTFFKPMPGDSFESMIALDAGSAELFNLFNGSSQIHWVPTLAKVKLVAEEKGRRFKLSDFPWFGDHVLVMKRKSHDALVDIFVKNGELLPLELKDKTELWAFNSQVIDAFDEDKSSVIRSQDTGRITCIEKPVFIESKLSCTDLFRLPFRTSPIYVSERFVKRYKSAGLVGLEFKEVWCGVRTENTIH